ncbi:MAG: hypothetical protein Q7T89_02580, partial [Anaerolineales bacterium]|nr:hypothetical protein [Anaerolineales bacterium]
CWLRMHVIARRALALPDEAIPRYKETAHLHCNKRSAAQVSAKNKSASQRHAKLSVQIEN